MKDLNIREVENGLMVSVSSRYPGEASKVYVFETPWSLSSWIGKYLTEKKNQDEAEKSAAAGMLPEQLI